MVVSTAATAENKIAVNLIPGDFHFEDKAYDSVVFSMHPDLDL